MKVSDIRTASDLADLRAEVYAVLASLRGETYRPDWPHMLGGVVFGYPDARPALIACLSEVFNAISRDLLDLGVEDA